MTICRLCNQNHDKMSPFLLEQIILYESEPTGGCLICGLFHADQSPEIRAKLEAQEKADYEHAVYMDSLSDDQRHELYLKAKRELEGGR